MSKTTKSLVDANSHLLIILIYIYTWPEACNAFFPVDIVHCFDKSLFIVLSRRLQTCCHVGYRSREESWYQRSFCTQKELLRNIQLRLLAHWLVECFLNISQCGIAVKIQETRQDSCERIGAQAGIETVETTFVSVNGKDRLNKSFALLLVLCAWLELQTCGGPTRLLE